MVIEIDVPYSIPFGSQIIIEISEDAFAIEKANLHFGIGGGWDYRDWIRFVKILPEEEPSSPQLSLGELK